MANRRFNVAEFSSEVGKRGLAKPSYFSVMISLPDSIKGFFDTSHIPLRIESASLPPRSLMTIDQNYHGPTRRIPYRHMNAPMRLKIALSENMIEREIFMAWQDLSISSGGLGSYRRSQGKAPKIGGFDSTFYDEMVGRVSLLQFAESPKFQVRTGIDLAQTLIRGGSDLRGLVSDVIEQLNPLNTNFAGATDRSIFPQYKVTLEEAYPINISEIELDWASEGTAKMYVDMEYFIAYEQHPAALPFENMHGLESLLRGTSALYNRFSPLISVFSRNGISGGIRAIGSQVGSNIRNTSTAFGGAARSFTR
jgi:hypothetical protein